MSMFASLVSPATATATWSSTLCIFSDVMDASRSLEVIFFSAASTTPCEVSTPTAEPALLIASIAYSTW